MTDDKPPPLPALTIDARGLGRYTIAQSELIDVRMATAFAAGVCESGERYWNDTQAGGVAVHPGLAFALQYRSQPKLGVATGPAEAWIGAVHADSDVRIISPLRQGQVVTTQGQVVARRQVKSGVVNVERYRMVGADGALLVELDFGLVIRGASLAGADLDLAPAPPRPSLPPAGKFQLLKRIMVTRNAIHHYTACSGIYAAIHTELTVARAAGFHDIILQGSAIKAMALSCVIDRYFDGNPTRITRLCARLRKPVFANTAMTIEVMETDGMSSPQECIFFRVVDDDGQVLVSDGFVGGRATHQTTP